MLKFETENNSKLILPDNDIDTFSYITKQMLYNEKRIKENKLQKLSNVLSNLILSRTTSNK